MTTDDHTSRETHAEARARLLWNDLPGTGDGGDQLRDHLWDGLRPDEREALQDYCTAVWEAAQLDLGQRAIPMTVTQTGRGSWGTAVTLESTDDAILPEATTGTILAVLR